MRRMWQCGRGFAVVVAFAAACGGGGESADDADSPDAERDAPDIDGGPTTLDAHSLDAPPPDSALVRSKVFVAAGLTTNSGANAAIALDSLEVQPSAAPADAVHSDPVLRRIGDVIYILNRGIHPDIAAVNSDFFIVQRFSSPLAANPQDIAIVGNKEYIPSLGGVGVAVLVPGELGHTIDLSDLDVDGKPDCMSIYKVDNKLFIACAVLDQNSSPRGPGKIAVVDATTEARIGTLTLSTANPISLFEQLPNGDLVISTVPIFVNPSTGCIERITTSGTPAAAGCMISNSALGGGYASMLAVQVSPPMLYLAVTVFPNSSLRAFDLATSVVLPAALTPGSQRVGSVATCPDGEIVTADTTMTATGLRVFDTDKTERTSAPLSVGFAPNAGHGLICY